MVLWSVWSVGLEPLTNFGQRLAVLTGPLDGLGEGFSIHPPNPHYCCIMFVQASCIFLSSSALGIG